MGVLWIGHEADCYIINSSTALESANSADGPLDRAGMRVGNFETSGYIQSTPDWAAVSELYHRFNDRADTHNAPAGANFVVWAAQNAAGLNVARLVTVGAGSNAQTLQFQVWNGSTYFNVGAAFNRLASNTKYRCDLHFKGGGSGQAEIWFGTNASQMKVLDEVGDFSSATNIVRIVHYSADNNAYYTGNEIVQTFPTLNSTSESKFPTSNGTDVGGTGTFADVDETSWNDADYVSFSAAGQRKSFKATARTATQTVVTGVTVSCRACYETGGPTQLKPYLLIGGVRYYGTTFNLTLLMQGYQYTWATNPATGVAFTPAEANAATLEWGWEAA